MGVGSEGRGGRGGGGTFSIASFKENKKPKQNIKTFRNVEKVFEKNSIQFHCTLH